MHCVPCLGCFLVKTFFTLADNTAIHKGAMYLHARMFCTLAHVFYSHGCNVFIQVRMFFTLPDTTSIPIGAMYLHARTFCPLSDTILYPLQAPIFTVITEVWPHANWSLVTNDSTVIVELMLIEGFLYK